MESSPHPQVKLCLGVLPWAYVQRAEDGQGVRAAEFSPRDGRKLWAGRSWVDTGQRNKQLTQVVMNPSSLKVLRLVSAYR